MSQKKIDQYFGPDSKRKQQPELQKTQILSKSEEAACTSTGEVQPAESYANFPSKKKQKLATKFNTEWTKTHPWLIDIRKQRGHVLHILPEV